MKKIVVLDAGTLGDDLSLAPLEAVGDVTVYRVSPPDTVRERIAGADAVILNKVKIGEDQLPAEDAPCGSPGKANCSGTSRKGTASILYIPSMWIRLRKAW